MKRHFNCIYQKHVLTIVSNPKLIDKKTDNLKILIIIIYPLTKLSGNLFHNIKS